MKNLHTLSKGLAIGSAALILTGCGEAGKASASLANDSDGAAPVEINGVQTQEIADETQSVKGISVNDSLLTRGNGPAILRREDVQRELGLSKIQIAQIEALIGNAYDQQEVEGDLNYVLTEEQFKRYRELNLQRTGYNALTKLETAERIGLSDNQVIAIKEAIASHEKQRAEGNTLEAIRRIDGESNKIIRWILTNKQKAKWDEMLGELFEFAEDDYLAVESTPARTD